MKVTKKYRIPFLSKGFAIGSLGFLLMGWLRTNQAELAAREIEFRKIQLEKPVLRLTADDIANPPWNAQNLSQWLYRRVEIDAWPDWRQINLVNRVFDGVQGYQCIVPYFVKEKNNQISKNVIFVARGFIPKGHSRDVQNDDRKQPQKILGFVSRLNELGQSKFSIFSQREFSIEEAGNTFGPLFFTQKVESSKIMNRQAAAMAVIECLHETGIMNQNMPMKYIHQIQTVKQCSPPFSKTQAGALSLNKTPDRLRLEANIYYIGTIVSLMLSGLLV